MALNGKVQPCFEALDNRDYDEFWNIISSGHPDDICYSGENALHIILAHPMLMIDPNTPARIKIIKQLLEWKVNINVQDVSGETPLYNAVTKRDIDIIPFLLANGANMRIKITPPNGNGTATALSYAYRLLESKSEQIPMLKIFMLHGAKIDEFYGDAPEIHANEPYNPAVIKFYKSILRARQIATVLVGMHRYKRSPLFSICGKDCVSLIAHIIYDTRGGPVWIDTPLETTPQDRKF